QRLHRLLVQGVAQPWRPGAAAEAPVEADRLHVPVEHVPLHPDRAAPDALAGERGHERLPDPPPARVRRDDEILEAQAVARAEGPPPGAAGAAPPRRSKTMARSSRPPAAVGGTSLSQSASSRSISRMRFPSERRALRMRIRVARVMSRPQARNSLRRRDAGEVDASEQLQGRL